jgi:arabinofuranosyltransferase
MMGGEFHAWAWGSSGGMAQIFGFYGAKPYTARVWRRALIGLGPVIVACFFLLLHAWRYDYVSDDAFIFARYARNLVQGHGLVFNPGERVEGFTSLAWVLWLAFTGALGIDVVMAMRASGVICALACLWAGHALAVRRMGLSAGAAAVVPLLMAASAPFACWAPAGLETPAFALAILLGLLAFDPEASHGAAVREGACASLCLLLRPEGALVPLSLAAVRLHSVARGELQLRRGSALPAWALPVISLGAVSAFRLAYYRDLVPNTARAKDAAGAQWQFGLTYAHDFLASYGSLPVWLAILAAPLIARGQRPVARAAATLSVALIAALIAVGGDGLGMYRFFVPILPLFALLTAHGADAAWRAAPRLSRPLLVSSMRALIVLALCALALRWAAPDREDPQYQLYDYQQRVELPRWREVGLWLAEHTPPDASVACVPIGAIGYYSQRVVRDMVGLTDRHIAALPSDPNLQLVGHRKHDGPYILSLKPSILLLGNVRVRKEPLAVDDPNFARPPAPAIRMREADMFGAELARDYEPRVARLPDGAYLHYYARRSR